MASENLKIDANTRWTLGAVTNDANEYIKNVRVNPITGALIVEAHITSSNTMIGSTIPGGMAGSVLFLDVGGTLAQDHDHFFYDPTGHFLGLGITSPDSNLHVVGTFHYVDGSQAAGYALVSDSNGNATWENLAVNTTFVTNIANDTTFVDNLISNTEFTTNLSEDNNFVTNLSENTTFTTLLSGLVAVAVDGVTITGDGTTSNPLIAVMSGGGSVTNVSVVTANGISGTVANPTTTPAITLVLGAITPSSVNSIVFSGSSTPTLAVTGTSSISGTNTGNQTITLTGDITGSGTGSFAATIGANKVTYAKMQAVSSTSLLLGSSSTTTPVQEITLGTGLSMSGTTLNASSIAATSTSGALAGTSGTQTITHSLGRTPITIRIYAYGNGISSASASYYSSSSGAWTSSGNTCVYAEPLGSGSSQVTPNFSTSFAIFTVGSSSGAPASGHGVIQNVTGTTFDIVWTGSSAQAMMWEAQ